MSAPAKQTRASWGKLGWSAAFAVGAVHAWETFCYHQRLNNLSVAEQKVVALRTENGFYYSYYEEVVSAPFWFDGIWAAIRDRRSEAPDTINAVERFNIYQELVCGLMFRLIHWIVGDLAPDPWYFFRYCLYVINGAGRVAMLALAASCGGGGFRGGLLPGLAVASMLFLHQQEISRFHESSIINLREYWACPVIWMQTLALFCMLSSGTQSSGMKASRTSRLAFVVLTASCILLWQFSAFAFTLQVAALFLCTLLTNDASVRDVAAKVLALYLAALGICAVMLFFNELLIHHVLVTECFAIWATLRWRRKPSQRWYLFWVDGVCAVILFGAMRLVQSPFVSADSHLGEIFDAKIRQMFPEWLGKSKKEPSFNARLYLAVSVFDFIKYSSIESLMPTFVLQIGGVGAVVFLVGFLRALASKCSKRASNHEKVAQCIDRLDAHSFAQGVLVVQLIFFSALGCFFDRLKILPGPLVCLMAGVALSPRPIEVLLGSVGKGDKSGTFTKILRRSIFVAAVGGQIAHLAWLASKMPLLPERIDSVHSELVWSDADTGELSDWMVRYIPANATIMDSMSLAGQVRAVTPHKHVIHPQFESRSLRDRVQEIYKFYQCTPAEKFVPVMKKFGAEYLIIEYRRCDFSPYPTDDFPEFNCDSKRPWEDLFCVRVHLSRHFKLMFANSGYAIFKMHPNASEIPKPRCKSIEDMAAWNPMLNQCQKDEPEKCGPRVAELALMWQSKLKKPRIADMLFKWALQAKPENGQTSFIYGHHLDYELQDNTNAIRHYQKAYELSPNNPVIVKEYLMWLDLVGKDNRTLERLLRTRRTGKGEVLSLLDLRDAGLGCEASVTAMQLMRDQDYADDLWEMAKREGIGNTCMKNNWPLHGGKSMENDLTKWGFFLNVFWHLRLRSHMSSQAGSVRWQQDR
eukprot:CAMPEP_0169071002 /NCGR_PEP_ID=MMETSP1015-20121227/5425_1 /TAXON_ID=342587 /ORGANISM="Karlodinium micrum, Strain CCMP2283" /LENGTH=918 /DNA_ID=CAMNT_0009130055 /DNA_START=16 /DNA_END=2768 /DNA_ORIENTATION=-